LRVIAIAILEAWGTIRILFCDSDQRERRDNVQVNLIEGDPVAVKLAMRIRASMSATD
jgi:hypothetical protein